MRYGFLVLLILIPFTAQGWEPYKADVTQEAISEESQGIDHLLPIAGTAPRLGFFTRYYLIAYNVSPALAYKESHLIIYLDDKTGKYILGIWETWSNSDKEHPPEMKLTLGTQTEVTKELADLALQMWSNALLEVRYDRKSNLGFDGEVYTFSTWIRGNDWLQGFAWSPEKELPPKWMVQAGNDLLKLGRDPNYKAADCLKDLQQLHDKLFAYLKGHGRN